MAIRLTQVFHLAGNQQSNSGERGSMLSEQRKWDQQTEITKQKCQTLDLLGQRWSSKVRVFSCITGEEVHAHWVSVTRPWPCRWIWTQTCPSVKHLSLSVPCRGGVASSLVWAVRFWLWENLNWKFSDGPNDSSAAVFLTALDKRQECDSDLCPSLDMWLLQHRCLKEPWDIWAGSHQIFQNLYWFSLFWISLSWKDLGDICPILPVLSHGCPHPLSGFLPWLLQAEPTLSFLPRELHLAQDSVRLSILDGL